MKPQRLTDSETTQRLQTLYGWSLQKGEITRTYTFSDFVAATAFVNHAAVVAEGMDHHPDIDIRYNKVTLTVSTHSAGGLTELDFLLAQQIDG